MVEKTTKYIYNIHTVYEMYDMCVNFDLDLQEVILIPIVNKYYEFPHDLLISTSENKIRVSGKMFGHEVKIIYTPKNIVIKYFNQKFWLRNQSYWTMNFSESKIIYDENHKIIGFDHIEHPSSEIPSNLPPVDRKHKAKVIFSVDIPEVTIFYWNLWHDNIPKFNETLGFFANYNKAFYININCFIPNPFAEPKNYENDDIRCDQDIINRIQYYSRPIWNGVEFSPLVDHRALVRACIRWRVYQQVRYFNQILETIPYLPKIGHIYSEASSEFHNLCQ